MKHFESKHQSDTNRSGDGVSNTVWLNVEQYYIKLFSEFPDSMHIYNTLLAPLSGFLASSSGHLVLGISVGL